MTGLVLAWTGPVPADLVVFGLRFERDDVPKLLWVLLAANIYLLIGFLAYAGPDVMAGLARYHGRWAEGAPPPEPGPPWQIALVPWGLRYVFDVPFPVALASVANVAVSWRATHGAAANGLLSVMDVLTRVLTVILLLGALVVLLIAATEAFMGVPSLMRYVRKNGRDHHAQATQARESAPSKVDAPPREP